MYTYDYVKISVVFKSWGPGGNNYRSENHKDIINKKAKEGWRYVGFIPALQKGTGHIQEMDLVFEKEI